MNLLFACSELFPLIKTGGLADVSQSLPLALHQAGVDVTLILPAYRSVLAQLPPPLALYEVDDPFLPARTRLLEQRFPGTDIRLLLVQPGDLFDRDGGPYSDEQGLDWPDNGGRFAAFSRAVVALLAGRCQPLLPVFDVVHCNDWQTGLVPALVALERLPVRTLFTIHNLAYQGIFPRTEFDALALPAHWWHYDALEFYGNCSFLKAGIVFADVVTTVSPTYAKEILQEPLACGMSGLLQYHRHKLHGILNGADYALWNPASDSHLRFRYDADNLPEKLHNKLDLQRQLGLRLGQSIPLLGVVSRLVHQKGADWIIEAMRQLNDDRLQWVVLGTGDRAIERELQTLALAAPKRISVNIGYDETLAHRIEAAADVFVMPSRYEPCGLNQIYSLRYGTLPLVRATGGLADTVVDISDESLRQGHATGFVYQGDTTADLVQCIRRATGFFTRRKTWEKLQRAAMAQHFDWRQSAQAYLALYQQRDALV
ncbi:MAG TPA: glycogen synthase GlgA [Dongiaceae bacterium]|nr:glycogen synthase GlgA [Dongiaceae bacterium]